MRTKIPVNYGIVQRLSQFLHGFKAHAFERKRTQLLLQNAQLKAGYNLQIGTEEELVVGFSVHQRPDDPGCLIPHSEETKAQRGVRQQLKAIADSAYGSEENYVYLEQASIHAYVKYHTFHQETKPRYKPPPLAAEQMPYDEAEDHFTCLNGKHLQYKAIPPLPYRERF